MPKPEEASAVSIACRSDARPQGVGGGASRARLARMSDDARPFVSGLSLGYVPESALWFVFRKRELLVNEHSAVPAVDSLERLGHKPIRTQYLGTLGGEHCFSAEVAPDTQPSAGCQFRDLRALHAHMLPDLYELAGRAVQIVEWDRTHQFCGACSSPTRLDSKSRARACESERCGLVCFPRLSPAIIVSVERRDEILLARSPHFPPGILSVLAGFVDPGESLEQAVAREVMEETGIRVKNIRYFNSQPWPFPNSLMLGFQAQYESGELVLQEDEIEDAGWYRADNMPRTFPSDLSISQWLIRDFVSRHSG